MKKRIYNILGLGLLSLISIQGRAQGAPESKEIFCAVCQAEQDKEFAEQAPVFSIIGQDAHKLLSAVFRPQNQHFYIDAGKSFRPGTLDAAVGLQLNPHIAFALQFKDEGKQPDGIKNINRPINLDMTYTCQIYRRLFFVSQAGLTTNIAAHNGSNNGFNNLQNWSAVGFNAGGGLELSLTKYFSLFADATFERYAQSDKPGNGPNAFENYMVYSGGGRLKFWPLGQPAEQPVTEAEEPVSVVPTIEP